MAQLLKALDKTPMGQMIRDFDWSENPLGPINTWPEALRTTVSLMLGSNFAMFAVWGDDNRLIYNDAYAVVLGAKHPAALGQNMLDVWPEIATEVQPLLSAAIGGQSIYHENLPLTLLRKGFAEQTWWTFNYSPIREGDAEAASGMYCTCIETTDSVLAQQRDADARQRLAREYHNLEVLNRVAAEIATESSVEALIQRVCDAGVELSKARFGSFFYHLLAENGERMLLYTLSGADRAQFEKLGMPRMTGVFGPTFQGHRTVRSEDILFDPRYGTHGGMPKGHLPVRSYLAVPVAGRSGEVIGSLLFGHPEPKQFDEPVEQVIQNLASQAGICIENLRLLQATQRDNENLEHRVAEQTEQRDRMWRLTPDLMLVARYDSTIEAVNPAWETIMGHRESELLGKPFLPLVHEDWRDATIAELGRLSEGATVFNFENRVRTNDGSYRAFLWTAVPSDSTIQAVGRDITAEREAAEALTKAEEQLRQSQKMEAVGQLTGGVAHDFNNLLTVIKSSVDLLKRPDLTEVRRDRYVGAISDTVDRASKLTVQLLAFARRQALKPQVFEVTRAIESLTEMLRTITGSRIRVEMNLPKDTHTINADPSQFDTSIVNMAVNARDAMSGTGTLTIAVAQVSRIPASRGQRAVPGEFVAISLTDTGSGIPLERIEQVFEPFFTTKGVGQGTGLGLSQVFGFAKQSGGEVRVETVVGEGTTFTLYLPLVDAPADALKPERPMDEPLIDGHGTRVLVVEDNTEVGQFATQALEELGYISVWAMNADEALAELDGDASRFDVVFSDVMMPGMNGIDLARKIRTQWPSLPVVLTSGYSDVLASQGPSGFDLLQKPYSVEQLSRILREATRVKRQG